MKVKDEDISTYIFICEHCRRPSEEDKESESSQKRYRQNESKWLYCITNIDDQARRLKAFLMWMSKFTFKKKSWKFILNYPYASQLWFIRVNKSGPPSLNCYRFSLIPSSLIASTFWWGLGSSFRSICRAEVSASPRLLNSASIFNSSKSKEKSWLGGVYPNSLTLSPAISLIFFMVTWSISTYTKTYPPLLL